MINIETPIYKNISVYEIIIIIFIEIIINL